jgi:hypothetical protein
MPRDPGTAPVLPGSAGLRLRVGPAPSELSLSDSARDRDPPAARGLRDSDRVRA